MKAYIAAEIAGAAYPQKPEFLTFEQIGLKLEACFIESGTEVYLLSNDRNNIIVFRGTDSPSDWLTNLSVAKTKTHFGAVHAGFNESVQVVWDDIVNELLKLEDKPVVVIGHSKGAAEAVVTVERLVWLRLVRVSEVHLFGCPRVGDAKFADNYRGLVRARTYRYVNNNDIVCRVPSCLRFRHVGKRIYLTKDGVVNEAMTGLSLMWDRLRGRFKLRLSDGLYDHDMRRYRDIIKQDT